MQQQPFEIYQWLVPLLGVIYLFRTVRQYLRNKRSAHSTVIWLVFWVTIMVLAIIPNPVSHHMAVLMGFKSNINAVIFVALGWLFLLVYYLSSTIDKLESQLTELTRKLALAGHEPGRKATAEKPGDRHVPVESAKGEAVPGELNSDLDHET
ncbi:MAG: hypothetical protein RLY31_943 [Bacteroidota bacterium]|jgi:hypothetical protein